MAPRECIWIAGFLAVGCYTGTLHGAEPPAWISSQSDTGNQSPQSLQTHPGQKVLADVILERILEGKKLRVDWDHFSFSQENDCNTCPVKRHTTLPTLSNLGNSVVDVPCGYSGSVIANALLNVSVPSNQGYYLHQQVVYSSRADYTESYVTVSQNGTITVGTGTPSEDVTQTISFTVMQYGSNLRSNTINITFIIHSCVLNLSGPTGTVSYCATASSGTYPQLTLTVKNAPQGVQLVFDKPSDMGGLGADTATLSADEPSSSDKQYAPAILNDQTTVPAGQNNLFVINLNAQLNPYPNNFAIYGPNADNTNVADGCQVLRFSVSPRDEASTPFVTGSTAIQVCPNGPC